jgi:hypothetical protein
MFLRAIASLATAVHTDPRNASAVGRLYTMLVQGPTPWLMMERSETSSDIVSSAVTENARVFAIALENGTFSLGEWRRPGGLHIIPVGC